MKILTVTAVFPSEKNYSFQLWQVLILATDGNLAVFVFMKNLPDSKITLYSILRKMKNYVSREIKPLNIHFSFILASSRRINFSHRFFVLDKQMIMVNCATIGIATNIPFIGRKYWNIFGVFYGSFFHFTLSALTLKVKVSFYWYWVTQFTPLKSRKSEIYNRLRKIEYISYFMKNENKEKTRRTFRIAS